MRELGKVASRGGSGERGWRAELELGGGKSLDDHLGPPQLGQSQSGLVSLAVDASGWVCG